MDRLKTFFKNNWKILALIVILFIIGFKLFHSSNKVKELNKTIIEKEFENKQLQKQLESQEKISDSLKIEVDSLTKQWENTPKEKIVKDIKIKYDEKRNVILNANGDEQLNFLSSWLSQKSGN